MKKLFAILVLLIFTFIWAQAELKVASLSTITTDIAHNVGGDKVEVFGIVKPGIDPHEFEPTPQDVEQIEKADLVLLTGKGINDGYLAKLEQAAGGSAKFIDIGGTLPSLKMQEEGKTVEDPHWWHSIENVKKATAAIGVCFGKADPVNKATYDKNAATYIATLNDLEKWAKRKIATLPRDKRKLVTSHDAFQYFAHDFGFTIYGIQGVSTEDQPSSKKIRILIDTIKSEGVKAVFFENAENPKVVAEITKESGAKVGGELYADGLGSKEATTYPEMIKYNITTIVDGLK